MAYGSSSYGSEAYGGASNLIPSGIKTFFLSGALFKTSIQFTFTLDARLFLRKDVSLQLDAKLILRNLTTFTLTAVKLSTKVKTFTLSAVVQHVGTLKNFSLNAKIVQRYEKTFTLTAALRKTFINTFILTARCYVRPTWLDLWKYRIAATICGGFITSTPGYTQIKVHKGIGTSSGEDVYLNGQCKDDFSDIRFTKQDGISLLPYTLSSSIIGDTATFLVKIDYVPVTPDNTSIFVYYQNSSATSAAISFADLGLSAFESSHVTCKYQTPNNIPGWETLNFNDTAWTDGNTPFHSSDFGVPFCPSAIMYNDPNYTDFPLSATSHVFIRKVFYASAAATLTLNNGIDNLAHLYFNGIDLGTTEFIGGCSAITDHSQSIDVVQGINIIAWDISGDIASNAFDFIFTSLTGLYNAPPNTGLTVCGWGIQQQRASGKNIMRTHRVGMRIING